MNSLFSFRWAAHKGLDNGIKLQIREINIYNKDIKLDFKILKERPIGPHKTLPPNFKLNGRIGPLKEYKRIIHYPEKYTIAKLPITKLGGRDPVTKRKVIEGFGGGNKQKARWIQYRRFPDDHPKDQEFLEKIISLDYDPLNTAMIALTAYGNQMRWIKAVEGMTVGQILKSTLVIPSVPFKPVPGNAYVLGALPNGTDICNYEELPGTECTKSINGNEHATIVGRYENKVIVKNYRNFEFALDQHCHCVAGKVLIHPLKAMPIGFPNRLRWLGFRPRSGLWKRKDGTKGRKIKALPPVQVVREKEEPPMTLLLHARSEGIRGQPHGHKRPWVKDEW